MHIKPVTLANGQTFPGIYNGDKLIATTDTMGRAFGFVAEIDQALRAERVRHVNNIEAILRGEVKS